MTLAAPRSRQGKLLLVLALLAATVAVVGTFLWATQGASAQVATATTTVTVTDTNPGPVAVGSTVTYHVAIATSTPCTGTCTNTTFEIDADPNLWPTSVSGKTLAWAGATCTTPGGVLFNAMKCTIAGAVDDGALDVNYVYIATNDYAPGDQNTLGTIGKPTTCEVYDTGDGPGNGVNCNMNGLATPVESDYVVTPPTASNGPGQDHTIVFTLPANFTCDSDPTVNDANRVCDGTDVTISNSNGATATLVSAALTGVPIVAAGTVTVVINSPTLGNVKVALNLDYNAGIPYGAQDNRCAFPTSNTFCTFDIEQQDAVALKTYTVVAQGGTAVLRHVDLPDLGTEDASGGSQNPYCANYLASTPQPGPNADPIFNGVCGVLPGMDDNDDAIGSFHGACIIGSLLTFAINDSDITWHIDPVPPGVGPIAASVSTFAGPLGEPCVMWGAATTGTQQITAIYHEGLPDQVRFWWGTNPNLGLIKEWNTIDSTRIVSTTGDLGSNPVDRIAGNTLGAKDWTARNCSLIPPVPNPAGPDHGDCTLANLDGLTMPLEATFVLNPNNGSFIKATGRTFIDYTMGQHADAGGAYSGPVDGASQTYCNGTLSALGANGLYTCSATGSDCGSILVEHPAVGDIHDLQPGDQTTVLSSDKGVAFEFVPNDNGSLLTTINNADCGSGATICVTIGTIEANLFRSPPLSKEVREKICVQYHIGPPTNKTPILAWAGQRVVLENYWGDFTAPAACPAITGTATGGTLSSLEDTNAAFLSNPCTLVGRTVVFGVGTGAGQSAVITSNTDTQLNFAAFVSPKVAPDATTTYFIAAIPSDVHPCASNENPPGPVDQAALGTRGGTPAFGVQYSIQAGSGSFTGAPLGNAHDIDQTGHDAIVHVNTTPKDDNHDLITDPNSNCTSRIIVESEDQTEMDVTAYIVNDNDNVGNATPRSQQVAFVIYFMKFESQTLQLIPDKIPTTDVWDKGGTPTVMDPATGVTPDVSATVSDNVAAQVTVKGWVLTDNCPARDAKTAKGFDDGQKGEFFPANRCIFPDDWAFKAGAFSQLPVCSLAPTPGNPIPQQCRPEFDIASTSSYDSLCPGGHVAGPFSMLDQITHAGLPVSCGDSLAPYPPDNLAAANRNCLTGGLTYFCRENNFPDGKVNSLDAPMPPSLVQFNLAGAGFLKGIGKAAAGAVFNTTNPCPPSTTSCPDAGFNSAAIPAEPWISQINSDGEGYVWNTWGASANNGLYNYWTSLADHGPQVVSCASKSSDLSTFVNSSNPAANPCTHDLSPAPCAGVPGIGVDCVWTGGYKMTEVYSDEHGVAMALINGDANLAFTDCKTSTPVAGTNTPIVLLNGFYCPKDAVVGTSSLTAVVDYPDKRKHFPEVTNTVTITWKWNGIKDVTLCQDVDSTHHCQPETPGTGSQFHYVVFHVTDRDGFCGSSDSLHPVLGEEVDFRIDSPTGVIVADVNGHWAEGPAFTPLGFDGGKSATTHTFDTGANSAITVGTPAADECQAWIHISESLLDPVNVIVTAFDPEGTVTFDTILNPTPTPTPVPTAVPPTPTPVPTQSNLWADIDCSGAVNPVDSLKVLKVDAGQTITQSAHCPAPKAQISVSQVGLDPLSEKWGDADCNGSVNPVDSLKILKFDAGYSTLQQEPCPDIGSLVQIPVQP